MTQDIENQLMAWSSKHNLNWLIGFHNSVRNLFKLELHNLKNIEEDKLERNLQVNALHDYDRMLHINTFLMMYSYLEEWLYHCWKTYLPNENIDGNGSIGRFKNVVKTLGVDLSSKPWQNIKNAEEVRNCLLHANGRISLLKNPNKIKTIIQKSKSRLSVKIDSIQISGEYLQWYNENISNILDMLIKKEPNQLNSADAKSCAAD